VPPATEIRWSTHAIGLASQPDREQDPLLGYLGTSEYGVLRQLFKNHAKVEGCLCFLCTFEEASRAFWAGDHARMQALLADWPADVRAHVARLVAEAQRLEAEIAA